ncbi:MAG: hypothetical protein KAS77_12680 [Thermoplasmata archaeon]|nr:hypothetical protein [Thermoplasmata archaeon]
MGSGEDGAVTLGDSQQAVKNEVLYDLLGFVIRRILGDEDRMPKEKQRLVIELMEVLKG